MMAVGFSMITGLTGCGLFGGGGQQVNNPAAQVSDPSKPERNPRTSAAARQHADGIAAIVNNQVITRSEVRDAVAYQRFILEQQVLSPAEKSRRIRKMEREGLDALITNELILGEYDKRGIPVRARDVDAQVNYIIRKQFGGDRNRLVEALRQAGTTMRRFREEQVKTIKIMRMRSAVSHKKTRPPSPREVQDYYRQNIGDYRAEGTLRLRTITIPKRSRRDRFATPKSQRLLAQDIRTKLGRGTSFAEMARTYSEDSVARNGGDRGTVTRETLNPLLTANAFAMKAGQTSEVIEGPNNYYIIKVDSRQYGKASPLSEVRDDVEQNLIAQQRQKLVDNWVANLKRRALIKIY